MKTARDGTYWKDEAKGLFCWRLKVGSSSVVRKAKTKRELDKRVKEALTAVNSRGVILDTATRSMTVGAYLRTWLETYVRPARGVRTYQCYEGVVRRHAEPAIGGVRLDRLTSGDCQRLVAGLTEAGKIATANQVRTVLKRAFSVAMRQTPPLLTMNPMDGTEPAKRREPEEDEEGSDAMDAGQVERFLAECLREKTYVRRGNAGAYVAPVHRYGPLLAFAVCTGLRVSEANAMRPADVENVAKVRRKLTWSRGGTYDLEPTKSKRSRRDIPLSRAAREALLVQARMVRGEAERQAGYADLGFLWPTEAGGPFKPRNVQRALEVILERAGLPRFSLHDLRRTFASLIAASGTPPHVLQALMGHESIATTMRHYVRSYAADLATAVDAIPRPPLPGGGVSPGA